MNLYQETANYLSDFIQTQEWAEIGHTFGQFAAQKPHAWKLPVVACEAVGGKSKQAIPGAAALACVQISIILIDDMLDQDPRGDYHRLGHAVAANLAAAFSAAGVKALLQARCEPQRQVAAAKALCHMMLTTSIGPFLWHSPTAGCNSGRRRSGSSEPAAPSGPVLWGNHPTA